jgi:hypothetical protein
MRLLVMLALALVGCKGEEVNVAIHCVTTKEPAVECEAKQTIGKSDVEACWDLASTCGNGAVVKAPRSCTKVKDGGTAKVTIPAAKLEGLDKCAGDKPPVLTLSNKTLDGKPSDK